MGIPDHLTCLLRKLYAGQVAIVRPLQGSTNWFKTGKGVWQGCILSLCLFNLYVEYIMQNVDESNWNQDCCEKYQQPQICRWYHSNGRKWGGTKKPLDEGKRRVKSQQKTKILASGPITWWQIERENVEVVTDFTFLGSKITADGDCSH